MPTKSQLAIILSKLKQIEKPNVKAEQYATDSEIAAEVLWFAYMKGDVEGKVIADLGCGNGILGTGCLLLGAKKVYFIDNDNESIATTTINLKNFKEINSSCYEIVSSDINDFDKKVDVVVQNPPFGTRQKHADREFLQKAFGVADVVYSFHKTATKGFVEAISKDNNFTIANLFTFDFPLKQTMKFHRKRIQRIAVGCWRFERC